MRRTLAIDEASFGPDHPATAHSDNAENFLAHRRGDTSALSGGTEVVLVTRRNGSEAIAHIYAAHSKILTA